MSQDNNTDIKLNTPAYDQLSLNEKIAVFNREVHAFEDDQQRQIKQIWQDIDDNYIKDIKAQYLTAARKEWLQNSFNQAFVNLEKMLQAKTLYEAELYFQTYIKALKLAKEAIRHHFVTLQSQALELVHNADEVNGRIKEIEQELINLKPLYSANGQRVLENAQRELKEMAQIKDPKLFANKKKQFLDYLTEIKKDVRHYNEIEKASKAKIDQALDCGQAIFDARSSYLEDKNHWTTRANDIAEKSWVGTGAGLGVVGVLTVVGAVVMAPVAALGLGLVGGVYGAVDMGKTLGSAITEETTAKLGERTIEKPKQTWKEKAKIFAKKAMPAALCFAGLALGVAAIVVTGGAAGIALAAAGIVISAVGIGQMVYDKYQEKKEISEIRQQHKEVNDTFEKKTEQLLSQTASEKLQNEDSAHEEMRLLAGHQLTPAELAKMQATAADSAEDEPAKNSVAEKITVENEIDETENEGGTEQENEDKSDDEGGGEAPQFRP